MRRDMQGRKICWESSINSKTVEYKMSVSRKVIELFYDVVSPYSWLGFEVLCRYRHVWNIDLKLRPAFLGGIMQGSGNKPPGLVPNKFLYMGKDLSRLAVYFDVPLAFPADPFEAMFKKGSLSAMRFVTAVAESGEGKDADVEKVSRELWRRIWSRDEDITLPASLSEAGLKAGLPASEVEELLKLASSQEIKDKLKRTTQEALDHGAFGFPLAICHVNGQKEMFFGSDRFELMAHCIGEKWEGPQPTKPNLRQTERMSSLSEADYRCQPGDTICEIRVYEQEVIVVPVLFLMAFLIMLVFLLLLRFCPEKVDRIRPQNAGSVVRANDRRSRRNLQGIDAPLGLNPLEHESIALDVPINYSTFPTSHHTPVNVMVPPPELPRQRLPENFNLVSPLPLTFSMKASDSVSLYRARMEHRDVVLRVLKDSASAEVLGVVSLRAPLITVVEELENRDLLGFLWRCRQDHVGSEAPCDLTEKRIFTMSKQVASALEYLHKRNILHGNIGARSVLVSQELTAKLWGFGNAYARTSQTEVTAVTEEPGHKKWLAPEVLARRGATQGSDVWSFGILLFEMITLGDAPFSEVSVNELLQYLQRGKTLKRPANCSNSLYSIIKVCCQWKEGDRALLSEVIRKLQSGEKSANDKSVIRVPEPINIEKYLLEAGFGEKYNYTVF
ncbi:hypothetical protein AGOR_G00207650 [Albula goreensis]|uniref:Glutathione S-transferase kappa 1 n=1 Tax=Albula goreensis TaxID=1534307 RepID=A0A8T3CL48_9TELE|nr:hypothetical protein AGOR_G00207650 [Albula goreensis]